MKQTKKIVVQYDLDTLKDIEIFQSAGIASRSLQGDSAMSSAIRLTCAGDQRQCYGYGWRFEDEKARVYPTGGRKPSIRIGDDAIIRGLEKMGWVKIGGVYKKNPKMHSTAHNKDSELVKQYNTSQ